MNPELAYFLKINLAIAVFYAFYRLFFYKDTFFRLRRTALLSFIALAMLYPLFDIQDWVRSKKPMLEAATFYASMLPEEGIVIQDVSISDPEPASGSADKEPLSFADWILWGYWGVVLLLTTHFLIQLIRILWLSIKCKQTKIQGIPVHVLDKPAGPFSFFSLIFIHPESHTPNETEEILAHEQTHVRQWHSVDVILCELFSIICWPNPFAWLLKREVRHNLEYLADNTVIQAGFDSKSYQYHLLGLAHHQASSTLYNNFNVLHLKNRISMMNKKRSKSIGRTKYLLFVPLAGILMLVSNIEAVARVTHTLAKEAITGSTDIKNPVITEDAEGMQLPPAPANNQTGQAQKNAITPPPAPVKQQADNTNPADKKAEFPGGEEALYKFIVKTVKYPVIAVENGIQGYVITEFTIQKDGTISNVNVTKSVDPSLDKEAIRLIEAMPTWNPAEKDGKKVDFQMSIPVLFKIQGKELPAEDAALSPMKDEVVVVAYGKKEKENDTSGYPGGEEALKEFIDKTKKYPQIALENGIEGVVVCSFKIAEDGSVTDAKVIKSVDPSLDKEALRIINSMPKWAPPAKVNGKTVDMLIHLPIPFSISKKESVDTKTVHFKIGSEKKDKDKTLISRTTTSIKGSF